MCFCTVAGCDGGAGGNSAGAASLLWEYESKAWAAKHGIKGLVHFVVIKSNICNKFDSL